MRNSNSERLIFNADVKKALSRPLKSQRMFQQSTPTLTDQDNV